MKKKPQKKFVTSKFFEVIKAFVTIDKPLKGPLKEYSASAENHTRWAGNPALKLRMDEVRIARKTAYYYLWGRLIAKWDGKELWLDNGGREHDLLSGRLTAIYCGVFNKRGTSKPITQLKHKSQIKEAQAISRKHPTFKLLKDGYAFDFLRWIINSYPITFDSKGEITNFTASDIYVNKFVNSTGGRCPLLLAAIEKYDIFVINEQDKGAFKKKKQWLKGQKLRATLDAANNPSKKLAAFDMALVGDERGRNGQ